MTVDSVKAGSRAFNGQGNEWFQTLKDAAAWYDRWLCEAAFPLWWEVGADRMRGGFHEALSVDGEPRPGPRRAGVQAGQN